MKKIIMLPISLLLIFSSCSSQEADNDNRFYVQIENTRFYPRYSHRDDVEAFLGPPSSYQFFEQGGEGFYWFDFTVWRYEEGMLLFHFSEEGNIIRITVSSSYSKNVYVFGRGLNELNHSTVTHLLGQADIDIFNSTEDFIGSVKYDSTGSRPYVLFWFDDESNISWFSFDYDRPWVEDQ